MDPQKIRIEVNFGTDGTKVFINDVEQQNVFDVTFMHRVGSLPILTLERYVTKDSQIGGDSLIREVAICPRCTKELGPDHLFMMPAEDGE